MKLARAHLLPLSREGLFWFIISFAMLVTGLLKGINLITLLACWMVTLVLLNFYWAYPQLRFLTARRFFSEFAFAGTPFSFLVHIENTGKKPSLGISVHDAGSDHQAARFLASIA